MAQNFKFLLTLLLVCLANPEVILNIPTNCDIVNSINKCVKCLDGYILDNIYNQCVSRISLFKSPFEPSNINRINNSNNGNDQPSLPITLPIMQTINTVSTPLIIKQNDNANTNNLRIVKRYVDLNCRLKSNDGGCIQCYKAYYFNENLKLCVAVNPLCKTWNRIGECQACYKGYKLANGQCFVPAIKESTSYYQRDPNCFLYENNACINCSYRFYFNQDRVCTSIHPYCSSWDQNTGACLSCFDGYYLNKTVCLAKKFVDTPKPITLTSPGKLIQNCAQYNNKFQCIKCAFRYYFANDTCNRVSDLCKSWSLSNGECQTCYQGYQKVKGDCFIDDPFCTIKSASGCLQCTDRYFLNQILRCQQVNPLCKLYDYLFGTCTECYEGFVLDKGSCILLL